MEFSDFLIEVNKSFGINLTGYKEKQLKRRIESLMHSVGIENYKQYLNLLNSDAAAKEKFLDKVTINVSEFFRNPEMFSALEKTIMPELCSGGKKMKIWSAACSNGAEPYSLAIIMNDVFPSVSYRIDATDIDDNILKVAGEGTYEEKLLRNVSPGRLKKYFAPDTSGMYSVKPEVRKHVYLKKHDLLVDRFEKDYDLIVCRNVTIYFTRETQNELYQKFSSSLKPGGVLFIGATENIIRYKEFGLDKVAHFFYRKQCNGEVDH